MTAERDVNRIVRLWLEEGATALPDHVLDVVLDQLPATPQRRPTWPARRFRDMNNGFKIVLAAAVTAIAFAGLSIPFLSGVEGPGASPTPSTSPVPYTWPALLEAGTYSSRLIWDAPVQFTFTVPEGWESRDVEVIDQQRGLGVMFSLVGNVYADPCGHVLSDPPTGSTVAELATALSSLPGAIYEGSRPTPTEFAGYLGESLSFTVGDTAGCSPRSYYMWDAPPDSLRSGLPTAGYAPFYSEQAHHHVRILDVDGIRLLIDAMSAAEATPDDLAELQSVVDSIRIDRTDDPSSFGACTLEVTDRTTGEVIEEPYTVMMGPDTFEVLGIAPVNEDTGEPLLPEPPLAQIDFTGEGWSGRPGVGLVGPTPDAKGFATAMTVNGFQGSFVFDAPGTWIAGIDGHDGCFRQLPVEVLPPQP